MEMVEPGKRPPGAAGRVWAVALLCVGAWLMAGCSSKPQTAYQVMQEQLQIQAQARQAEDEAARKAMPSQPDMFLSLIAQSMEQGRHFAALAYVDAYIQQYGNTPDIAPLQANALRLTGQTAESEAVYRRLVSTGKAAEGWHGLGLLAGARGDFAQAADSLAKASRLRPTDADMLSDLGYARLRAGDVAGARLPLGQAAELNPGSNKIIANLALLLLVEGQTERALRVMDQANMSEQARAQLSMLAQQTRMPVAAPAASVGQPLATAVVRPATAADGQPLAAAVVRPAAAADGQPLATAVVRPVAASGHAGAAPAAPQADAAAQTRPRLAYTQPAEAGMHAPSMNFLANTPLVR